MHIIQIRTISAWKGAQERSGKPCSCYLVHSHAFYKEWADISRKCVAIVNHKRVVYWVNNYTKMKYMLGKHDAWCGAMVWPHRALVKMSSCTPFIKRTITEEVSWFRGGNHQDWRGIQISLVLCPHVFFLWWAYKLQITVFKFGTFLGSFAIFRGLCAFPRH